MLFKFINIGSLFGDARARRFNFSNAEIELAGTEPNNGLEKLVDGQFYPNLFATDNGPSSGSHHFIQIKLEKSILVRGIGLLSNTEAGAALSFLEVCQYVSSQQAQTISHLGENWLH